jgi:hypothetical protein
VDVRFGPLDHTKTYKGLKSLDLLPAGKHPIVAFMGVKPGGKTAVFSVADSSFRADGEGKCASSGCRFFELSLSDTQNEETISSTDGTKSYTLVLKGIHFKYVDQKQAFGSATPAKKASAKKASSKTARRAAKRTARDQSFGTLPDLGFASG